MNPAELRALSDALEPMAKAPRFEDMDVPAFCRWLRACADAKPVAWMHIDGRVISAATMDQAYRDGGAMQSSLRDYTIPLYARPAPAVPQAEPETFESELRSFAQTPEQAEFVEKVLAAEPKREPACLWSRADDDTDVWETRCGHAFTIIDGTPGDNHMEFCCYCGRPLEQEIGGSDAGAD